MSDASKPAVDKSEETVKVYEDVPRTAMVVRNKQEARSALVRLRGDQVPNECLFCCIMCGWEGTIRFDDDEMAAMDNEAESYGGPCTGVSKTMKGEVIYEQDADGQPVLDAQGNKTPVICGQMTLLPKRNMGAGEFTPGEQVAKRAKMRELREQAEVNADVFIEKAVAAVAGGMAPVVPPPQEPPKPE